MARPSQLARIICLALIVECSLGGGAILIGWLIGHLPTIGMQGGRASASVQLQAAVRGLFATLPLLIGLLVIDYAPLGPLRRLRDKVHALILEMFAGASAAGFGEELLFRGLLQTELARLIGGPHSSLVGLALASVIFGVCHWLD